MIAKVDLTALVAKHRRLLAYLRRTDERGSRPETCPECGSRRVVPIVYGLPLADDFERAGRGEILLGGCVIIIGADPIWGCLDCDARGGVVREADI